jgi:hypothetical protein
LQGLFTAIPNFHVKVVSAGASGDNTLAVQWVITGTWKKPFPSSSLAGKKPTGKSFDVPGEISGVAGRKVPVCQCLVRPDDVFDSAWRYSAASEQQASAR